MKTLAASFLAVLFVSAAMAKPVTLDQQRAENLLSLKYVDGRPLSANQVVANWLSCLFSLAGAYPATPNLNISPFCINPMRRTS